MNGHDYPSAKGAFNAIGLTTGQRRKHRKELRRTGKVTVTHDNRTYVIETARQGAA